MKILAITMARHSQFSAILGGLSQRHDVTLLSPDGPPLGDPIGVSSFVVPPVRGRTREERCRLRILDISSTVHDVVAKLERSDVIFGQASFGCLHRLDPPDGTGLVTHVELPAMEMSAARYEFPLTEEDQKADDTLRSLVEHSLRRSDVIIKFSRHSLGLLPADLQDRAHAIMEGFEVRDCLGAEARRHQRLELGLCADAPIVGFFGRTLEAVRGFDYFVATIAEMRRRGHHFTALSVGDPVTLYGNERAYLGGESFVSYSLRTHGLCNTDLEMRMVQPPEVFRRLLAVTDVAVFPIFENAGNWSFFEAMSAGVATVSARTCFFPEVVRDGENGMLVEVRDVRGYADAVEALLWNHGERRRIAAAGQRTIAQRYSVARAVSDYAAAFREASERSRSRRPS